MEQDKMKQDNIPDWLAMTSRICLLGEIYPEIRAIACKWTTGIFLLKYYMDREPTEKDWDSADLAAGAIGDFSYEFFSKADIDCVYATDPLESLDPLDGFLYARREW